MNTLQTEFAQIAKENKSTIYTVCYMFSKDTDEVNDLFQEVLVNLWKGMSSFKGQSDIRTWIYRIALNTCISTDRKKKITTIPLSMDANLFQDQDEDTKQVKLLHNRISKLQPFDKAIVLLWLENISYDEIGEIVGISTKNVASRLFRIKEKLRTMSNDLKEFKMEKGYYIEQQIVALKDIIAVTKDIGIFFETAPDKVQFIRKEYFEDGNSIKTSRKTDLFRTHFISLRDNEYLADNLVKAFKKAGYKIEKGYWYD